MRRLRLRRREPEVGLNLALTLGATTRQLAEHVGERWLAEWGDKLEQRGVTVTYEDVVGTLRTVRVGQQQGFWRLIELLRYSGTVWSAAALTR